MLSVKSVLDNFIYAFSAVVEKDKCLSGNLIDFNSKVRDYQRTFNLIVKNLKRDVKTNVQTQFHITAIEESAKDVVTDARGKTRSSFCLKMKQDIYVRKVIVLTVLNQFIEFSLRLEDYLTNFRFY